LGGAGGPRDAALQLPAPLFGFAASGLGAGGAFACAGGTELGALARALQKPQGADIGRSPVP
jgi:hypothetical protein